MNKSSIIDNQKFDYLTELHSGNFHTLYPGLTGEWEKDKARWVLIKMMKAHVNCAYSGLPTVSSYASE